MQAFFIFGFETAFHPDDDFNGCADADGKPAFVMGAGPDAPIKAIGTLLTAEKALADKMCHPHHKTQNLARLALK